MSTFAQRWRSLLTEREHSKRREALIVGRSKERRDRYATIRESQELVETYLSYPFRSTKQSEQNRTERNISNNRIEYNNCATLSTLEKEYYAHS